MNKQIKIDFNQQGINNAIKKLELLNIYINNLPNNLVKEIADDGLTFLNQLYASTSSENNINGIRTSIKPTSNGYAICAEGRDVIYEEFGTGELGKDNPHPEKHEYSLNDYNSGPIVSTHINSKGRHYWFYNGKYYEGTPSGKQFFNTRNYIQTDGIKKAKYKLVGDILSKL